MSRYSVDGGNGASCDVCGTLLKPFKILRLCGLQLVPGPNYKVCSSDTRYKHIAKFHLCDDCYTIIVEEIKNKQRNKTERIKL